MSHFMRRGKQFVHHVIAALAALRPLNTVENLNDQYGNSTRSSQMVILKPKANKTANK